MTLHNAKGPAATAIAPDHGSILQTPSKDMKMNSKTNSTSPAVTPARRARPSDKAIVDAVENLLGDVLFLRQATLVLDEYACSTLRAAKGITGVSGSYHLAQEDVDGIQYMLMHVRELATCLDVAMDKAFGLEERA